MSTTIDAHFTRLTTALETLIKSLSTYNPSPQLANDLVTADGELNQGLEQLHTHQNNHMRLLALRTRSLELDAQIKDSLLLLTSTRTEILSLPGTSLPSNINPVSYAELLSYARRISKTTLPGSYREAEASPDSTNNANDPSNSAVNDASADGALKEGEAPTTSTGTGANTNGNSTPVASALATPTLAGTANNANTAVTANGEQHSTKLPPQFDLAVAIPEGVFVPWPHDYLLRRGTLATIQVLVEKGETLGEGEGEGDVLGGEGKVVSPVYRRESVVMENNAGFGGGGPAQQQQRAPPKKKGAFELENFDDDDDDDDEDDN